MNNKTKKRYPFKIQAQEVDFQNCISLAALTNILLSTAGLNADENGFGIRKLNENDSSWVLLRIAVEMDYFPKQYQEITVETWVEEVGRATTVRNFKVMDIENKTIGTASSIWAMINLSTRKAQDLMALEGIRDCATYEKVDMDKPIKLQTVDSDAYNSFRVSYNDIDINNHTNSLSYVKWISNCFSLDDYKQKLITRFEINYISEIFFGDEVSIHKEALTTDDYRFEARANGKNSCRARVVFK